MQAIGIGNSRVKRPSRGPRRGRSTRSSASPLVMMVAAAALFSAGVAGLWQWSSTPLLEPPPPQIDQALLLGPITQADEQARPAMAPLSDAAPVAQADALLGPPQADETPLAEEAASEPAVASEPVVAGGVPASERVTSAYFDDAAFVGDSITTGIKLYDVMSNADVFAATGVSLDGIFDAPVIKQNGESISIPTALGRAAPKKIYVMLGANSLGGAQERLIGLYGKFIDLLKQNHPDSIIYIQSVLPLHEEKFKQQYKTPITNEGIDSFNVALNALATEKGVYYLDVASVFKDQNGAMPAEDTPDGIHIHSAQYTTWFDYLKTHAIVK